MRKQIATALGGLTFRVGALVPLPGALETFFELDARLVAKDFARQRNVGLRIADVAVARRIVAWPESSVPVIFSSSFRTSFSVIRAPVPPLKTIPEAPNLRLAGSQSLIHHVFDVGEIARLLAVAINDRLFALRGSRA